MEARHAETLSVAEQAAQWLLVMQSPRPEERAAFWQWLDSSPLHVREIILATRLQQRLRGFDRGRQIDIETLVAKARANIASIGGPQLSERQSAPARLLKRHRMYVAASVAAVTIAIVAFLSIRADRNTYATALGQQLVLSLDDGSVVSLNTKSRLKVRFSQNSRDVYLPDGQALFDVKRDPARPFRVHAAASIVEAVGTQFDVRVLGGRTMVSVVEGVVKVVKAENEQLNPSARRAPQRARLAAGEAATVNASGEIEQTSKVDVATVAAWKQQRLIFNEETLGWIVDEFNRYNETPRLMVEGEALRSRRFNGVFSARSPDSLIEYLQHDPSIAFDRKEGAVVIREAAEQGGLER